MKTDTEVSMLLAIAAILLIIAVVGGIAVHPLLFLIAILAVVALVAGRR
jgi:flagellar biosynthesis component FlhA